MIPRWTSFGKISILVVFCSKLWTVDSIPCSPETYEYVNPDGTHTGPVRCHGGHEMLLESVEDYTITKAGDGYWYFAEEDPITGDIKASTYKVGKGRPKDHPKLKKWAKPTSKGWIKRLQGTKADKALKLEEASQAKINREKAARNKEKRGKTEGKKRRVLEGKTERKLRAGNVKNLVVLCRWEDHSNRVLPPPEDIEVLFNHQGKHELCPTGSVRDHYLANSYGQLDLQSTVTQWLDVPGTEAYYAENNRGLTKKIHEGIKACLTQLDNTGFDFSAYDEDNDGFVDSITFLHSGVGAEFMGTDAFGAFYMNRLWSHKWSLTGGNFVSSDGAGTEVWKYHISPAVFGRKGVDIGRIGVIAHETGHYFALKDYYDTDSSPGEGFGSWGMMANSWGLDMSQKNPPISAPYNKILLGWVTPTEIATPGQYTLRPSYLFPEVFKITRGFPDPNNEYLLIEFRDSIGFESLIKEPGLAVWHIDELATRQSEGYPGSTNWPTTHYEVAIKQRDCQWDLEKGSNRGDSGDLYTNSSFSLGPGPSGDCPNTDSYSGASTPTGIYITNIRQANEGLADEDHTITFNVGFGAPFVSGFETTTTSTTTPTTTTVAPATKALGDLVGAKVFLTTDAYAAETSARIEDADGVVVWFKQYENNNKNHITNIELYENGEYTFFVDDVDGLTGNSKFELEAFKDVDLIKEDSPSFTGSYVKTFTVPECPKLKPGAQCSSNPDCCSTNCVSGICTLRTATTKPPTTATTTTTTKPPTTTTTTTTKPPTTTTTTTTTEPPTTTTTTTTTEPPTTTTTTTTTTELPTTATTTEPPTTTTTTTATVGDLIGVKVKLTTDDFASQTSVRIEDTGGVVVWSKQYEVNNKNHVTNIELYENGEYTFFVDDEDGISGNGKFELEAFRDVDMIKEDSPDFTGSYVKTFTVPECPKSKPGAICSSNPDCCSTYCVSGVCTLRTKPTTTTEPPTTPTTTTTTTEPPTTTTTTTTTTEPPTTTSTTTTTTDPPTTTTTTTTTTEPPTTTSTTTTTTEPPTTTSTTTDPPTTTAAATVGDLVGIKVRLTTDENASQTSARIESSTGEVVWSKQYDINNKRFIANIELYENGAYTFFVDDVDGMNGNFEVEAFKTEMVVDENAPTFIGSYVKTFTVPVCGLKKPGDDCSANVDCCSTYCVRGVCTLRTKPTTTEPPTTTPTTTTTTTKPPTTTPSTTSTTTTEAPITLTSRAAATSPPLGHSVSLNVVVNTDGKPTETEVTILDMSGNILFSKSNYNKADFLYTSPEVEVFENGQYKVVVEDVDGLCCSHGAGSYTIQAFGEAVVASGGSFSVKDEKVFIVPACSKSKVGESCSRSSHCCTNKCNSGSCQPI